MKYFGTDGIRGVPNKKLNTNLLLGVGKGLSHLGSDTVCIATDTRISKDMISSLIAGGAMSMNLNVLDLGVIPTPALIYYSYIKKITGVMVTASHNPYTDNGLKVLKNGYKLSSSDEEKIEDVIENGIDSSLEIGSLTRINSPLDDYYKLMSNYLVKTDLKIAIDCANGATFETAPHLFSQICDNLIVIHNNPNGTNINNNCGSTHLEDLIKTVKENNCDLGFAFDGDGDRVLAVNSHGEVIDGDKLIYIFARYLKDRNELNDDTVVLSMMSNLGLIQDLNRRGIKVCETNVGDKYVVEALNKYNLSVGGENSGHIILPKVLHTGDGVLNALMIVKILTETNTLIDYWFETVSMYSDKMVNIKVENKNSVLSNSQLFSRIEEIKKELNGDCKIIVRPSGTEELIRVSVMALTDELVSKYSDELVNLVKESC